MKFRLFVLSIIFCAQIHAAGLSPAVADVVKIFSDAVLKYAFEGQLDGATFTSVALDADGNYLINKKPCINFSLRQSQMIISTPSEVDDECLKVLLDPSVVAISAGYYMCKPYVFANGGWQSDESVREARCSEAVLKEFGLDDRLQDGFKYQPVLRDKLMNLHGANQSILMEFNASGVEALY